MEFLSIPRVWCQSTFFVVKKLQPFFRNNHQSNFSYILKTVFTKYDFKNDHKIVFTNRDFKFNFKIVFINCSFNVNFLKSQLVNVVLKSFLKPYLMNSVHEKLI